MKHHARKRFGQNFLHDENIIHRIIDCIHPQPSDHIVEIGPGQAALTQHLFDTEKLDLIEIDRDLIPALKKKTANQPHITIHEADALTVDFASLQTTRPLKIVGNLPYNISTPLLFHLFSFTSCIDVMYFMLQKEVVQRLCAQPGDRLYGRLSVMSHFYCQADALFDVPPDAFSPQPKVTSSIVCLQPHQPYTLSKKAMQLFSDIVRHAFQQRRKTLRNTLKPLVNETQFAAVEIDPLRRAETLSLAEFVKLTQYLSEQQ